MLLFVLASPTLQDYFVDRQSGGPGLVLYHMANRPSRGQTQCVQIPSGKCLQAVCERGSHSMA